MNKDSYFFPQKITGYNSLIELFYCLNKIIHLWILTCHNSLVLFYLKTYVIRDDEPTGLLNKASQKHILSFASWIALQ